MPEASTSIWRGARILLRAAEPPDVEALRRWDTDSEMMRRAYHILPPGARAQTEGFIAETAKADPETDEFKLLICEPDGAPVGMIGTHHLNKTVGNFRYFVALQPESRGKSYASEAILLLLRYMFRERRYVKCTISLYAYNTASARLHERLGFQREGAIRCAVLTDGRHWDELLYGLTAGEFEQLHGLKLPYALEP